MELLSWTLRHSLGFQVEKARKAAALPEREEEKLEELSE
jgi:hypothetical protein